LVYGRKAVGFGLLRKLSLGCVSVALTLSVLLECVLNRNLFVHHYLAMHVLNSCI